MKNKILSITLTLLIITIITGCAQKTEPQHIEKTIPVSVFSIKSGLYYEYRSIAGEIEAWQDVTIVSQVNGEIIDLNADFGDYVKESQQLAKIDDRTYKAQTGSAKSSYQLAKNSFNRQKELHEKKLISDQTFESLKNQMEIASANYQINNKNLEDTQIRTPFSGIIAEKYIEKNQQASIGMPLFRVTDTSRLKIKISIVATDINNLWIGQTVKIKVDAMPQKTFNGKILKIGSVANKTTKLFPIEISMNSYRGIIKAGMLCNVTYIRKTHKNVFVIARDIIEEDLTSKGVYIASGNTSVYKEVNLVTSDKENAIISSGLNDDDLIIFEGISNIANGSKISYSQEK